MFKIPARKVWGGAVAGVAIALAISGSGLAQQESQRDQDQRSSNQSDEDRDSDRDQQDQQRDEQNQQSDQQQREQRQGQQQRQQDQQTWQRDEENQRQSGQTRWDESRSRQWNQQESTWPEPNRYGQQQQTQYQYESDRRSSQYGGRDNEQDAGLGVTIIASQDRGVIVTRVFRGTPADQMGLQNGDRITQLNGQEVRSVSEFINRIRNMNPGDEVELEVMRNRDEQTVRGELETRQDALLLSSRQPGRQRWQGDPSWQTGYQDSGGYEFEQGRTTSGEYSSRLNSIERQVSRLSRELEQIRFALQDLRQGGSQQYGRTRESQAGYDEYQGGYQTQRFGSRQQTGQFDGQSDRGFRESDRGQFFDPSRQYDDRQGSFRSDEAGSDSPGGVTGGLRTRPDNDQNWENR
jgi:hypothetical protein